MESLEVNCCSDVNVTMTAEFQPRVDIELMEWLAKLQSNRRLPNSIFYPLLAAYALMIIFGVMANVLIIGLILRQRSR